MKSKFVISIFLCCLSQLGWNQDYGKEIKRILTDFSNLSSYEIRATVSITGDENYSFSSSIKCSASYGSHIVADLTEMLVNKNFAIAIDHEDKTIRIDKGDYVTRSKGKSQSGIEMIDQIINDASGVEYIGSAEGYRTYVIYNNNAIEKTVVKINSNTGFFQEIQVFYNSNDVSISSYTVKYTSFKKNPTYKKENFDQNQVFTQAANGELIPTAKYKGYQIIKHY